ncbi:Phosphomethylpyrimidine kinase [Fragilaria crotonensis]|nr:Phosphomethylpyrimidine kinase [Fragilaria crotonensis]
MSRVLSIQSHVVSGYVGNKAAVFPLQLLGFDVDVVNSVHFSNHTGYPGGWTGEVLNGDQLRSILAGLDKNGLLHDVAHLLTGYIGSESFLTAVLEVLTTLRQHGKVRFVCDPVLGDAGQFYVPQELVQVYREKVIPLPTLSRRINLRSNI